ncbi:bifunctional metallophosphatase/5'-nucleotidase [Paenibacillus sp. GCM10023252]|uniref:bifunctional metallophosphatase/5'-nucleotidase n=1 Tax=Paenibacillus sp. GCM10023252 TaxID=3252649 RepID=UPI0036236360
MKTEVVLLHSNDIHSRLENAAKIASYIAEERRMYGSSRVLAVDVGDHMDRMRAETEGSDGLVNIALLNSAGYEAVTIGNNEGLTYSAEDLHEAYYNHGRFKVVCANLVDQSTGELPEWAVPSTVLVKKNLTIGLIGVTARFTDFYTLMGWEVSDPLETIQQQVKRLREQVDVIVVMSHLGLPMDRRIAEELHGVDLILGGHTHHLLEEPLVIGDTTICAAGKFGEQLGRVEIGLDPITSRPLFRASCVPVAALEEQPEAAAIISSFKEAGDRRLSRIITRLSAPLPASTERESPLGNLLAAGLRRWTDAEIGIVNTGQLLGGLPSGEVTAGQLHALCPSPINPCRLLLSGTNLRAALEQSLLCEYTRKPIKGFGFRGEVLGGLAVDGLTIAYDLKRPPLERITSVLVNGRELVNEAVYSVGTIDMFTFRVGYETLSLGAQPKFFLPEFIRDVLAEELQNEDLLRQCQLRRWNDGE